MQKISNMRVQFVALAIVKILVIQFIRYCTQPFIENTKWYCHQSRNRTVVEDRFISYGKNNTKDSWNLRLVVVAWSLDLISSNFDLLRVCSITMLSMQLLHLMLLDYHRYKEIILRKSSSLIHSQQSSATYYDF